MRIIALDPSGNHNSENEGDGTTGIAKYVKGEITLWEIKASDYRDTVRYWADVVEEVIGFNPDYIVIEGYKLYNHAGMSAQTQSNSTLMTSQLIGCIKLAAHESNVPLYVQYASDVKTRWSNEVLRAKGILEEGDKFKGKATNNHKRDALRHLMHFKKYKLKEITK